MISAIPILGAPTGAVDDRAALLALIAIVAVVVRELLKWLQTRSAAPGACPHITPEIVKKIEDTQGAQPEISRKLDEVLELLRRENPTSGQKDIYVPRQLMDEIGKVGAAVNELDRRFDELTHQSGVWSPRGD